MMLVWTIPDVCYRYLGTLQIFQEITIKEEQRSFARQECDFFYYVLALFRRKITNNL
jgi:hypothetical protein